MDMNHPWIYMCSPSWSPPLTSLSISSLWVFPVHQPWALVSCIQPGLAICFTLESTLVSMLFSQNIPPLPAPTESKCLFYTSVSLFLFCTIQILLPSFKILHICISILYWSLSFRLTSLCMMGSSFIPWSFNSALELSWHLWVSHFICWLRIKV